MKHGGITEEEENDDYGGMAQPSQQHVVPCVKGRLGRGGLRITAVFRAGIPVSST